MNDSIFLNVADALVNGLAHDSDGSLPALSEPQAAVCVIAAQIKFIYQATGGDWSLFEEAMSEVAYLGSDMELALAFPETAVAPV